MKDASPDLVRALLAESLAAWRVTGSVERASDGALVIVTIGPVMSIVHVYFAVPTFLSRSCASRSSATR